MSHYLSPDIGFSVLEDQSQVLNAVGLEEAVDLCLAGQRDEQTKHLRLES